VNTASGELARTIDSEQVLDLALNGRDYMELVTLIPGVAVTSLDQMATTTSLSVTNESINGNRTDTNHLMVDGGMNLDSDSNGSQINNVGVDFIQQVRVQTSAFCCGRYSAFERAGICAFRPMCSTRRIIPISTLLMCRLITALSGRSVRRNRRGIFSSAPGSHSDKFGKLHEQAKAYSTRSLLNLY
jgi:hypothetical protein